MMHEPTPAQSIHLTDQQTCAQGGHYLMIVKPNQRQLWEDLDLVFRIPAIPADQGIWDVVTTVSKGHGRIETRRLECGTGLEAVWRGHWTIENRKHYVRDVTLGEDRNQMHSGDAPRVLASLRSGLIDLWRSLGWTNIADAMRECAASVQPTLSLIGALPQSTLT